MARPRGSRQVAARSRRSTAWDAGTGGTGTTAITASESVFLGSAVSLVAGVSKLTVVRTRGEFLAFLTQASALDNGFRGAFGIGIASLAAVTAGIASVPTPISDAGSDNWLYHRFFACVTPRALTGATALDVDNVNVVSAAVRYEVDSKAMRIMTDDQALYACVEVVEAGTALLRVSFDSRILAKLH